MDELAGGEVAGGERPMRPRPVASRWWRWGWPLVLAGLAGAVPLLVWLGWSAIVASSDGTEVSAPLDPAEPGYQAYVEPTPLLVLIHAEGTHLRGVTLLALTDERVEGAVLFLAPETVTPAGPLSAHWAESGRVAVMDALAELVGIRASESQVVDDDGWAALVSAVAPVVVDNPDPLVSSAGDTVFGSGELALNPSDVAAYLGWRNPGESPIASLVRHELFWERWMDDLALSTAPALIPGETDRGMGRFAPSLAMGGIRIQAVPGTVDSDGGVILDAAAAERLVNEVVPFPISTTNGSRPRVKLLNGIGDPALTHTAARALSRAGARITLIGNAAEFGWETTRIAYHHDDFADDAEAYRIALGTGAVIAEEPTDDATDVTVTFGADYSQAVTDDV